MDKKVFPVPAGPMPKTRSDLYISSQSFFFWFLVLMTNFFVLFSDLCFQDCCLNSCQLLSLGHLSQFLDYWNTSNLKFV